MSLAAFRNWRTQFYPPKPTFTEEHVGPQNGRVFIVTGGNAGERAEKAIEKITSAASKLENPGSVKFLHLDLNDLDTVKSAAASFARREPKLDVLWNNAGTGGLALPVGSRTRQGMEPMVGMHCVAAQLFMHLLLPQLRAAVPGSPTGSVRVVWTSSFLADSLAPANGVDFAILDEGTDDGVRNYAQSKAGNWLLGREMATRYGTEGIVSVTQNPGNLKAGSYAGTPALALRLLELFLLHETRLGGCTELYAGLSPDISLENNGAYVIPWGRVRPDEDCPRKDIVDAMRPEAEGGSSYAQRFWDWCEEQWRPFV